jgi:hypothetical protein
LYHVKYYLLRPIMVYGAIIIVIKTAKTVSVPSASG